MLLTVTARERRGKFEQLRFRYHLGLEAADSAFPWMITQVFVWA